MITFGGYFMSLTEERKQYYLDVIARTGQARKALKTDRIIPDWYTAFKQQVKQYEIKIPTEYREVRCVITESMDKKDNCPLFIHMHGGGFYYPQDEDDDMLCARIATQTHGMCIDIDYALALDQPYPAAFVQCYTVCKWAFDRLNKFYV
jgi:acetyl esterase/lipase